MTAADREVVANLRLVQGRSNAARQELRKTGARTLLTVGADPHCDWSVQETGVAPIHFSLLWDGSTLMIANTYGASKVHVDGVPLGTEWRRIAGLARVDFGNAAVVIEAFSTGLGADAWREPTTLPEIAPVKTSASVPNVIIGGSAGGSSAPRAAGLEARGSAREQNSTPAAKPSSVIPIRSVPASLTMTLTGMGSQTPSRPSPSKGPFLEPGAGSSGRTEEPGTNIVATRRQESDPRLDMFGAHAELEHGVPKAVLVLSPAADTSSALDGDEEIVGRSSFPARAPTLPSWAQVGLGIGAVVLAYLCWLFLLYNL